VAGGPEQAAGDQVEVARVGDGFVVVADRGGEDLGLAVVGVGPCDDVILGLLGAVLGLADLLTAGERLGGVEELADVVVYSSSLIVVQSSMPLVIGLCLSVKVIAIGSCAP
jgi:hypothetical protein